MNKILKWQNLTNFEIEKIDKNLVLVVPIGSVESHGHHLSTNNDNIISQFLSMKLCERINAIYCTPLTIWNTKKLVDFPWSLNIREEILKEYLIDILKSYVDIWFKKIFIINGHKWNNNYINNSITEIWLSSIKFVFYKDVIADILDKSYNGFHSNRLETEIALLAKKESVFLSKVKDNYVFDRKLLDKKFDRQYMPDCIDWYPTEANKEDAMRILDILVTRLVVALEKIEID